MSTSTMIRSSMRLFTMMLGAAVAISYIPRVNASNPSLITPTASFDVGADGQVRYRAPIFVAPAPNGMSPSLAIEYTGGGNGIVGMGWGLSVGGAITRCPRTLAFDGIAGAVNIDSNDRFCLGGQPLALVAGAAYGAPDSEYRTEPETTVRVFARGGS